MKTLLLVGVSQLELARGQFAATAIYHFLFAPITIGLGILVAVLQTAWYRKGDEDYLRLTRFFGTLLIINVAVGVVTGLVMEFQFGMAWSDYSRFVGDVFGAPLAIEVLAAFFLESVFLGLWFFGWERLPRGVHLATIWLVAIGSILSAVFIMSANSWMQHPVGYEINGQPGHAQLTSIWAVLTNHIFLWSLGHVLLASMVTGSALLLAVSAWHIYRRHEPGIFRKTARIAIFVLVPAAFVAILVGSELGASVYNNQPMKIAAAEALWNTEQPADFTLFQIGGFTASDPTPSFSISIPHGLSILATNSWNGQVLGMNQVQAQYESQYGPGNYMPNSFNAFWSIRIMAYLATLVFLLALWGWWLLRRNTIETSTTFLRLSMWVVIVPLIMNTFGWILAENGRQPWIVQGLLKTESGVSPSVTAATIATSLGVFVLLYGIMAVIDAVLMIRFARRPIPAVPPPETPEAPAPAMTY